MRNKGKRFLVCCMALGLLFSMGAISPSYSAYQKPENYKNTVTERPDMGLLPNVEFVDTYSFINIKNNEDNNYDGGALSISSSDYFNKPIGAPDIGNSSFSGITGANRGGALFIWSNSSIIIENSSFVGNSAFNGGAIYSYGSPQITNAIFENNFATLNGGAVNIDGSPLMAQFTNVDFLNNKAGLYGGALFVDTSKADWTLGARIWVDDGQTHYMSGNIQQNGISDSAGTANAIYIWDGQVDLQTRNGADSKLVIDDGIEGLDIANAKLNVISGRSKDDVPYGGSISLNNEVKNVQLTHKSGTLLLNHNNKLADGAAILNNVDLKFQPDGGNNLRFDLANGKMDNLLIRNLSITEPKGDQKLLIALDVNLKDGTSDFFNVEGTITGGFKFDAEHFEFNIVEEGTADKFQISNREDIFTATGKGEVVQYNGLGKYVFTVGEDGYVNVTGDPLATIYDAVADEGIRSFRLPDATDVVLNKDLGTLGGEALIVDLAGNNFTSTNQKGISLAAGQKLEISNAGLLDGSKFIGNFTNVDGAMINNAGGTVVINNSYVSNNSVTGRGGAIFTEGGTVTITDSILANNSADTTGGAIHVLGGAVVLNADKRDVIFRNNTHEAAVQPVDPDAPIVTKAATGNKNDIYLENAADGTKATLAVNGSKNTIIESGIAGNGEITKNDAGIMKLGGDNSKFTGDVYLNGGEVQLLSGASYFNAKNTFVKNNSRINLANNNPNDVVNFGNLNLDGNAKLGIDLDGKNNLSDKIGAISVTGDGKILIDNINVMSYGSDKSTFDIITLDEATKDSPLLGLVELSPEAKKVISPIFKYQADFDSNTGVMSLVSGPRGDKNSYNPSILATPVALQTAAQAGIKEAVNYAFEHNDAFTKLPYNERFAQLNSNKYAISEFNGQLPLYNGQAEGNAVWFRPYTVFEEIGLSHGPKVDNLSYGSLIGFDAKFKERRHGWTSISSGFLGYQGSSLDYGDIDIMSNGALLGITKNYYRKNFWTALTMAGNIGLGKVSEMYGDDDIVHLSGAVSSKTGYNLEMADGKFIIQPNIGLSYYISKIFDYTNEAGVRINSDPLNSFEIKPGIRLVGNTKGGWQPYLSAAMVWNTFDKTNVRADGIKLPGMNMDPYVEYGLGFQRIVNNDFTCYLQSLVRNGGRTGVALTGGMSWAIGADDTHKYRIHL